MPIPPEAAGPKPVPTPTAQTRPRKPADAFPEPTDPGTYKQQHFAEMRRQERFHDAPTEGSPGNTEISQATRDKAALGITDEQLGNLPKEQADVLRADRAAARARQAQTAIGEVPAAPNVGGSLALKEGAPQGAVRKALGQATSVAKEAGEAALRAAGPATALYVVTDASAQAQEAYHNAKNTEPDPGKAGRRTWLNVIVRAATSLTDLVLVRVDSIDPKTNQPKFKSLSAEAADTFVPVTSDIGPDPANKSTLQTFIEKLGPDSEYIKVRKQEGGDPRDLNSASPAALFVLGVDINKTIARETKNRNDNSNYINPWGATAQKSDAAIKALGEAETAQAERHALESEKAPFFAAQRRQQETQAKAEAAKEGSKQVAAAPFVPHEEASKTIPNNIKGKSSGMNSSK